MWLVTDPVFRESVVIRVSLLLFRMFVCFAFALQRVVGKTVLVLPSSNIPKVQGPGCAKHFLWNGCAGSVFKWLHLCQLFTFHSFNSNLQFHKKPHAELCLLLIMFVRLDCFPFLSWLTYTSLWTFLFQGVVSIGNLFWFLFFHLTTSLCFCSTHQTVEKHVQGPLAKKPLEGLISYRIVVALSKCFPNW